MGVVGAGCVVRCLISDTTWNQVGSVLERRMAFGGMHTVGSKGRGQLPTQRPHVSGGLYGWPGSRPPPPPPPTSGHECIGSSGGLQGSVQPATQPPQISGLLWLAWRAATQPPRLPMRMPMPFRFRAYPSQKLPTEITVGVQWLIAHPYRVCEGACWTLAWYQINILAQSMVLEDFSLHRKPTARKSALHHHCHLSNSDGHQSPTARSTAEYFQWCGCSAFSSSSPQWGWR